MHTCSYPGFVCNNDKRFKYNCSGDYREACALIGQGLHYILL